MLILFKGRKILADAFEKWADENKVKNCPINVIAFLGANDLLDGEKVNDYINRSGYKGNIAPVINEKENTSEDCVSREEVFKTIAKWLFTEKGHYDMNLNCAKLRHLIEAIPSATPVKCIATINLDAEEFYNKVTKEFEMRLLEGESGANE